MKKIQRKGTGHRLKWGRNLRDGLLEEAFERGFVEEPPNRYSIHPVENPHAFREWLSRQFQRSVRAAWRSMAERIRRGESP